MTKTASTTKKIGSRWHGRKTRAVPAVPETTKHAVRRDRVVGKADRQGRGSRIGGEGNCQSAWKAKEWDRLEGGPTLSISTLGQAARDSSSSIEYPRGTNTGRNSSLTC